MYRRNYEKEIYFANSIIIIIFAKNIIDMRVICDAPGQTCNRLWTYLPSIAQCLAENKKMVIIFFDWTIEDFPNLLHAPFIYFPLYQKWFLKLPKGWGWYKQLTWTVTHNNTWNKIFKLLGFTKGWDTMTDTRYLSETKPKLKHIFPPTEGNYRQGRSIHVKHPKGCRFSYRCPYPAWWLQDIYQWTLLLFSRRLLQVHARNTGTIPWKMHIIFHQ